MPRHQMPQTQLFQPSADICSRPVPSGSLRVQFGTCLAPSQLLFCELVSLPFGIDMLGVINGTAKECSIHLMAGRQTGDRRDQSRVGRIPAECLIAFYICLSKCRALRRRLSEAVVSQEKQSCRLVSRWF